MKHKAQESLDILCEHAMVYEEDYDYEENECGEYKNMEEDDLAELKEPLQQLIDCQLTRDELYTLIHIYKRYCEERNIPFVEHSKTINKLYKQKEMWVSDDENCQ